MSDYTGDDEEFEDADGFPLDENEFAPIPTNLAGVTYTPPPKEKPVRGEGGMHTDYREEHPAYGIIGIARGSTTGRPLFGSDFLHHNIITLTLQHAVSERSLHRDWVHSAGGPAIVEVSLSEAQWATMISTPNVGEGVPCTIERINGERMPDIVPYGETRRAELNAEIKQTIEDLDTRLADLEAKATTKKMKFDIGIIRTHLRSNIPFVAESFDKHADKVIEQMKIEVAAYMTGAIARAGIKALSAEPPPITLIEPGEPEQESEDE
jgi:hypothetical protein